MNDSLSIIAIVEGPGEIKAVPDLLRRILWERLGRYDISDISSKNANGKSKLFEKFENFLRYAIIDKADAILVLVDADDECPVEQARILVDKASKLNLSVPVAIVYAKSEYETWFICSLTENSGRGIREILNIDSSVSAPDDIEDITAAKGWLERYMPRDQGYKETSDQEHLTHHIDIELTYWRSRSFRRMCHAVEELVEAIDGGEAIVSPRN